jgi:hypothetical protein
VAEQVRLDVIDQHQREAKAGVDPRRLNRLDSILYAGRIHALTGLCRGILLVTSDRFDAHPALLCVGNGVVDLATGVLLPHDPNCY